jgi:cell division septation protein DedD
MKTTVYLVVFSCAMMFGGCKAKQSAYQKVYEAAQSRSTVYQAPATAPAVSTTPAEAPVQTERVKAVDGYAIKRYSVVIGSFLNKTNAESLKERMRKQGYTPVLAQNENGMYRVLLATFDNKSDAYAQRDAIREKDPSQFGDAWLLERLN